MILAGGTTTMGRYFIRKVYKFLEDNQFEIIYGDTDSAYILPNHSLYDTNNT